MVDDIDDDADFEDLDDLGEPIAELRDLEEVPGRGFAARVMNTLRRRDLGSQLATLGWTGLAAVLLEFLQIVFSGFSTNDERGEAE